MHSKVSEILFPEKEIYLGIKKMATKINQTFAQNKKGVLLLGILKGCMPFLNELSKHLKFDILIDYMILSSYSGGTKKKLQLPKVVLDIDTDIHDKDVIIVDDILESGSTIEVVKNILTQRKAKSVKIAVLIWKKIDSCKIQPDWNAFISPQNKFLVGFGLDFKEKLRNLQYVGVLNKKFYEK